MSIFTNIIINLMCSKHRQESVQKGHG